MIKKIILGLVVLLVAVLAYAATLPTAYNFSRTATINVAPAVIFPLINDQRRWVEWSPWERLDPAMMRAFSGPAAGLGAVYEWNGNADVGAGRSEIVASVPDAKVVFRLDFREPMASVASATFTLTPNGAVTDVTWAMAMTRTYPMKLMGLLMNCEKMMDEAFTSGLNNLKALAEKT